MRGLLVPDIVLLLGNWNWWPGKLEEGHTDEVSSQVAITGTGVE